jgi:micrococcal nuclease
MRDRATTAALLLGGVGIILGLGLMQQDIIWHGRALDGDTFVRQATHYRIASIDAPELPGHCRVGRACAPGNPYAAKQGLQWFLDRGIRCKELGPDYYRRTLVQCVTKSDADLGDEMINLGYAVPYRSYQ